MSEIVSDASARIRSYVARVERLREEIAALNADVSEVYKGAKDEGFNVSALKAVVQERAKAAKDPQKFRELVDDVDLYRAALEGGTEFATRARTEAAE